MTAELVPLRTGFDVAWLGFRRDQVWHYVHEAERDIDALTVDRDAAEARAEALARHLEHERQDNRELRERLDRLCAVPLSPYAVGERLRHLVESTLAQAAEITDRATAIEDHAWESARRTHAEHRELLAGTRARMARILREGEAGRAHRGLRAGAGVAAQAELRGRAADGGDRAPAGGEPGAGGEQEGRGDHRAPRPRR
ncbi:hypothetical protein [Lentzea sp. NPDC055074]